MSNRTLPMKVKGILGVASSLALAGGLAHLSAAPIVPTYTTFGTLSGATFGGTGIPNDAVAITTIGNVTLGLTAHQRYANPPVGNNGAGDFYAVPGGDVYSSPPQPGYARWNFGWYVHNPGSTWYTVELRYDFDPGTGTDEANHGVFRQLIGQGTYQDSWNLGMAFLATPAIWLTGSVTPPTHGSFNPNVNGEYTIALILRNLQNAELGRAAIRVNVGQVARVPDGGVTGALLLMGVLGLASLRRQF